MYAKPGRKAEHEDAIRLGCEDIDNTSRGKVVARRNVLKVKRGF
jgi:hypothetical protein